MTTIKIITVFGRWDAAYETLSKSGFTLTVDNTVEVPNTSVALQKVFLELWSMVAAQVIAGFSLGMEDIQAATREVETYSFDQALSRSPIIEKRDEWWIHQVEMVDGSAQHGTYRVFPQDKIRDYHHGNTDGSTLCWNFTMLDDCKRELQGPGGDIEPVGLEDGWYIPEKPEGKEKGTHDEY